MMRLDSHSPRIIHLLWTGDTGGAERAVYQLSRYQQEQEKLDVAIGFGRAQGEFARRAAADDIAVYDFGLRSGHDAFGIKRARAVLARYDIHHFHCAELTLVAASLLCGDARRIYTHRGGVMQYQGRQALRYRLFRPVLRRRFQWITAAPQAARAVEVLFGVPARSVVESVNGVDPRGLVPRKDAAVLRAMLGASDDTVLIGTAATLRTIKRVDWLIRAVAELDDDKVLLVILGDGPDRARLEDLAKRLLPQERFRFPGLVDDIGGWLAALDIFVLASGPEEGFGNAVVEAMACGLPVVVCRDSPALSGHVEPGRTGFVVSGGEEMARCLAMLVGDEAVRQQIGRAAAEAALVTYPMARMAGTFSSLYANSIGTEPLGGTARAATTR